MFLNISKFPLSSLAIRLPQFLAQLTSLLSCIFTLSVSKFLAYCLINSLVAFFLFYFQVYYLVHKTLVEECQNFITFYVCPKNLSPSTCLVDTGSLQILWLLIVYNRITCVLSCTLFFSARQYFLIPWSRVLLEKLSGSQLVKKFPVFYGTRRFITAFTSARQLSLS
jgi:hypothetical protein